MGSQSINKIEFFKKLNRIISAFMEKILTLFNMKKIEIVENTNDMILKSYQMVYQIKYWQKMNKTFLGSQKIVY